MSLQQWIKILGIAGLCLNLISCGQTGPLYLPGKPCPPQNKTMPSGSPDQQPSPGCHSPSTTDQDESDTSQESGQ